MAAFLSATTWQQKLLVIHYISIFIGIPAVTLPSLILGTLSHSASASCQHGTPGKITEDFWKITRGSRREHLICFYLLCVRHFRRLQFASFLTFFAWVSPFFCSLPLNCFSFFHVFPPHIVPLPMMSFACSNPFHKNERATKHPLPFWCRNRVLFRHINEYWSLSSLTSFPFSSCSRCTKAPSRLSKAVNGCAPGKPAINNCG